MFTAPVGSCCWYCKSTKSQANHNYCLLWPASIRLLLVLQKYEISSKSQLVVYHISLSGCCCWYCKSTKSQANHNYRCYRLSCKWVVAGTAKVRNLKQITTLIADEVYLYRCCWYCKSTKSQANHNVMNYTPNMCGVVAGTAKVRNLKQITTSSVYYAKAG